MAVLAMKRINIYALRANRKKILEALQMRGAVQVTSEKLELENFKQLDTAAAQATFEKNAILNQNAVTELDKIVTPPKTGMAMFVGKTPMTEDDYDAIATRATKVTESAHRLTACAKEISDNEADILRLQTQIAALEPWSRLDVPMRTIATKATNIYIGSFPEALTEAEIKLKLAEAYPEAEAYDVEIIDNLPTQTNVFIVASSRYGVKFESALRSLGFSYPASPSRLPPAEQIKSYEGKITELSQKNAELTAEIKGLAGLRSDFLQTFDYFNTRSEKYRVLGELWQSPHVFIISGFIPAEDAARITAVVEGFGAYVEVEEVPEDVYPPVKLKNGWFAGPVEGIVESYSLPGKGEVDPSKVMSIFYYVLFGLMLSDAAYGLLITIGCSVILAKFKNMATSTKQTFRMFMYCGIFTIFWGIVFGSYFGDAPTVIAKTFFGVDFAIPPLWFTPLDAPMKMLIFSICIGIVHLFTGLGVQLYQLIKKKQFADALYDVVFWYMLVGGLLVALVSTSMFQDMFGMSINIPPIVANIALVLAGIAAVGIILTAGRESKNPGKRFLKGLYGLYNISGYLSDMLSYSRLLALGLATGVISSVFNQMGSMFGGGVGGAIAFTVIFLIGHAMNIAVNALGAYVHTNRLQYVEFFGKFYEGGGEKFKPFSEKTKYYSFTEEK